MHLARQRANKIFSPQCYNNGLPTCRRRVELKEVFLRSKIKHVSAIEIFQVKRKYAQSHTLEIKRKGDSSIESCDKEKSKHESCFITHFINSNDPIRILFDYGV